AVIWIEMNTGTVTSPFIYNKRAVYESLPHEQYSRLHIRQRPAASKSGHRNGRVIVVGPVSIACQEGYYVC
ncbi:hypothetical protein, partial [Klebsiella pneumoniae]|uniref:hypothetical protein n=1 Tax=Klebsiella pneumoniae TaxID=573 RepID=UPI001D0E386F